MVKRRVCWCLSEKRHSALSWTRLGPMLFNPLDESPEEQRYDHKLLQNVRGTPNPGDVSTHTLEPMLIIPQLPDLDPAPTKTYHSDNKGTRNVHIRKTDLEKVWLHGRMPSLRSSPCRIADVWAGTHRGMQETTCRRDDDKTHPQRPGSKQYV